VKLVAFMLRYLRRHLGWLAVAGVAAVAYAVTTVSLIGLIEPVFGEVLLADAGAVSVIAQGIGSGTVEDGESSGADEAAGGLVGFFRSINLRDFMKRRYQALKVRYDIDSREVVVFLPLLFLSVFLLRGLMPPPTFATTCTAAFSASRVGSTPAIRRAS
jgi:hypothetical protein